MVLLRRRASKRNPSNLAACQDFFFDTFSTSSGGDDEVATIAMRLQIGFAGSSGIGLEAHEVKLMKSLMVAEY